MSGSVEDQQLPATVYQEQYAGQEGLPQFPPACSAMAGGVPSSRLDLSSTRR